MTQIVDIRRDLGLRIGREKQPLEVLCLISCTQKVNLSKTNSVYCSLNAPLATLQICEKTTPPPNFKPQTDDLLMLQNCTNLILTTRCKNDNKIFKICFFNSKCDCHVKYQSILSNWWILHYLQSCKNNKSVKEIFY